MKFVFVILIFSLQVYAYNYGTYKENLKACNNDNAKRCNDLAGIYLTGDSKDKIKKDERKAQYYYDMSIKLYKKYCNKGHGKACFNLANKYNGMRWNIDQNLSMMAKYHEKACTLGYGKGCNELGASYKRGWGVEKDKEKSNKFYQKALILYDKECLNGFGKSCKWMGTIYSVGLYTDRDKMKALKYNNLAFDIFEQECQNNDAEGCYQLAYLYLTGDGVERNYAKAKITFEKSCKLGESSSCHEAESVDKRREIDEVMEKRIQEIMNKGKQK